MSQSIRTIVMVATAVAVLLGGMAIERSGGRAAATTIRPDKEQVRRTLLVPGTAVDPCAAPTGPGGRIARPTAC